jgi:hypothetical protein
MGRTLCLLYVGLVVWSGFAVHVFRLIAVSVRFCCVASVYMLYMYRSSPVWITNRLRGRRHMGRRMGGVRHGRWRRGGYVGERRRRRRWRRRVRWRRVDAVSRNLIFNTIGPTKEFVCPTCWVCAEKKRSCLLWVHQLPPWTLPLYASLPRSVRRGAPHLALRRTRRPLRVVPLLCRGDALPPLLPLPPRRLHHS